MRGFNGRATGLLMSSEGDVGLTVSNVSKCYRVFDRPQDRLKQGFSRRKKRYREFWALRDVSFSVRKGEAFGIIGRNGSGKSTLLQIIAGTVTPTTGTVRLSGRVTALLELGSGFNPEFTGKENVFVNGAILGFRRTQVEECFDDIVGFSGIGAFIDQPVRTYSTGMVLRLAFAVQAFLPKDLLIVDEVLAVGDEAFQRRCFAKIEEFQSQGGTILFVSHAAELVVQLCRRAILLDGGELLLRGASKAVVHMYQRFLHAPPASQEKQRAQMRELNQLPEWEQRLQSAGAATSGAATEGGRNASAPGKRIRRGGYDASLVRHEVVRYTSRGARIENARLCMSDGAPANLLRNGETYVWAYTVLFEQTCLNVRFGMLIKTVSGLELGGAASAAPGHGCAQVEAGTKVDVSFTFTARLSPGTYFLNAGLVADLADGETYLDRWVDAAMFRVLPEDEWRGTSWIDFGVDCGLEFNRTP